MINHSSCTHPATKAGRAACRRAKGGVPASERNRLDIALDQVGKRRKAQARKAGPKSLAEANEVGNIDHDTLDDRIRDSRRRPPASAVKVTKVDPASLRCD